MPKGNTILFQIGTFEFQLRHFLVIAVLTITFTTAFILRFYPAKYGFYLNEYDPYFNYRATKYIVDHGLSAYWKWHDTMSWYPEGRDIPKTSQSGLHIVAAFLYNIFGRGTSLLDFTIILPVIMGSLTAVIVFALVRVIDGTTTGMLSALLFAVSPAIIQRGNLGWFKSEPLGIFCGLLALYLFISAIKHNKEIKYSILKAVAGGLSLGIANASWGGDQYFTIPISLFLIGLPLLNRFCAHRFPISSNIIYIVITFTILTFIGVLAFPRPGISFLFSLSGISLLGSTLFLTIVHFLKRVSHPKRAFRNTMLVLTAFVAIVLVIIASRIYYVGQNMLFDLTPRYFMAISPFSSLTDPLEQSVAEHAKPTFLDYFINYSTLLLFSGYGIWIALKHKNYLLIFALIIGLSGIYVSTGLQRLQVYAAIGIIIFSGIGLSHLITSVIVRSETSSDNISNTTKKEISKKIIIRRKPKFDLFRQSSKTYHMSIICLVLIAFLLFIPMVYPPYFNWIDSVDIPPTIVNGGTIYDLNTSDWINALKWISTYTPKNAVIAAWWDYGYWITTLANRTTLVDNAALNNGVYKNHIPHVAQMFLNTEKDGYKIASNILADYVLIYVVAHRISVNDNDRNNTSVSYYALGDGGYESLIYWFSKIGRFDERKYLEQDKFTPTIKFWDTTLLGKLIPFTLRGYIAHNSVPHITDNLIKQQYTPGSLAIYSKHVKYPINSTISSDRQPFSLVYSSTSFTESNQDIISAVFLYKINRNYK